MPSMSIRTTIPEGYAPGQLMTIGGQGVAPFQVQVPMGAVPGTVVDYPVPTQLPPGSVPAPRPGPAAAPTRPTWDGLLVAARDALSQLGSLVVKNLKVSSRKPLATLVFLLLPAAMVMLLAWAQTAAGESSRQHVGGASLTLEPCREWINVYSQIFPTSECTAVAYSVQGATGPDDPATAADVAFAEDVMQRVAGANGLEMGADVRQYSSVQSMHDQINENPGYTRFAVAFERGVSEAATSGYTVWSNWTHEGALAGNSESGANGPLRYYGVNGGPLAVQAQVDAALVGKRGGTAGAASFEARVNFFDAIDGDDDTQPGIVPAFGIVFIMIGFVAQMLMVMMAVGAEKDAELLSTMRRMGLVEITYWVSFLVSYGLLACVSAVLTWCVGYACDVYIYSRADLLVHVFVQVCGSLGLFAFAMACAAVLPKLWSTMFSFVVALFIIIFTFAMSSDRRWQTEELPGAEPMAVIFFNYVFPFYHIGRAFDLILEVTKWVGDPTSTSADQLSFSDFGNNEIFKKLQYGPKLVSPAGEKQIRPRAYPGSIADACGFMILETILFTLLAWYLGQVFPSGGTAPKPFYFVVMPSYWGFGGKTRQIAEGDRIAALQAQSAADGTLIGHKLSKAYRETQALREVSFEMAPGQVWALLGKNGAGKSTLVNLLSGQTDPTFGEAFVFGMSVRDDMSAIQGQMGVCPQHDTLWPDLTARDHLMLYTAFKRIPSGQRTEAVEKALTNVGLLASADTRVGTFSGGMKRRISVAIASLGDPKVIFFDEPTTGMDPLSRRRVWDAIRSLVPNRIVILTTHSMEEADLLGDYVTIMHEGRTRAMGTSTYLKQRFGKGYTINMLCGDDVGVAHTKALVSKAIPGAEVLAASAGNLQIGVPRHAASLIPHFLRELRETPYVREWGFSSTSLEEVFMRLVGGASTSVNAAADDVRDRHDLTMREQEVARLRGELEALKGQNSALRRGEDVPELSPVAPAVAPASAAAAAPAPPPQHNPEEKATAAPHAVAPVYEPTASDNLPPARKLPIAPQVTAVSGRGFTIQSKRTCFNVCSCCSVLAASLFGFALAWIFNSAGGVWSYYYVKTCDYGHTGMLTTTYSKELPIVDLSGVLAEALPANTSEWPRYQTSLFDDLGARKLMLGCQDYYEDDEVVPPECLAVSAEMDVSCNASLASKYIDLDEYNFAETRILWTTMHAEAAVMPGNTYERTGMANYPSWTLVETVTGDADVGDVSEDTTVDVEYLGHVTMTAPADYADSPLDGPFGPSEVPAVDETTIMYSCEITSLTGVAAGDGDLAVEATLDVYTLNSKFHATAPDLVALLTRDGNMAGYSPALPARVWMAGATAAAETALEGFVAASAAANVSLSVTVGLDIQEMKGAVLDSQAVIKRGRVTIPGDVVFAAAGGYEDTEDSDRGDGEDGTNQWYVVSDYDAAVAEFTSLYPDVGVNVDVLETQGAGPAELKYTLYQYDNPKFMEIYFPLEDTAVQGSAFCNETEALCSDAYEFGDEAYLEPCYVYAQYCGEESEAVPSSDASTFGVVGMADGSDWSAADNANCGVFAGGDRPWFAPEQPRQNSVLPRTMSWIHNQVLKQVAGAEYAIETTFSSMPIFCWRKGVSDLEVGVQLFIMPLCMSFLFPTYVSMLVSEKHEKLVHMMRVQGMGVLAYFAGNYLYAHLIFDSIMFLLYGLSVLMGVKMWMHVGIWIIVAVVLGWTHAMIGMATFISGFSNSPRQASILAVVLLLVLNFGGGIVVSFFDPYPAALDILPIFAFPHALSIALRYGGNEVVAGTPLAFAIIMLWVSGTVLSLLGLYLFLVIPSKAGVPLDPLFVVEPLMRLLRKKPSAAATAGVFTQLEVGELGDEDVVAEREATERAGSNPGAAAVAFSGMRITYPARGNNPPKVAVDGLSLRIGFGEVFGLLGPNGAGKTSTLDVLSGMNAPSAGAVWVAGDALEKGKSSTLYSRVGVCPQFDTVWPTLTVEEHLHFYARARGIPKAHRRGKVQSIAEKVKLDGDQFRHHASKLSGGQRRRLSLAIALLGDPPIVILDEPSTGLDPDSRRVMWQVVESCRSPDRCVIITTHSMEECDTLATRVGIMAKGRLRCLGTQQHLKNRYGKGYKLVVSTTGGLPNEKAVTDWLVGLCPEAHFDSSVSSTFRFSIALTADVASLFERLLASEGTAGLFGGADADLVVSDWSLQQSSLEEVFISIAQQSEQDM